MDKLRRVFSLHGVKWAFMGLSSLLMIGMSLGWFAAVDWMMARFGSQITGVDTTLMLGIFIGALSVGVLMARFAKDGKGLTYGVYGGLAAMIAVGLMTWRSGLLAALIGLMAPIGGYNGGMLGEMSRLLEKKRR